MKKDTKRLVGKFIGTNAELKLQIKDVLGLPVQCKCV